MININLLSEICKTPGAPGFEQKIRAQVLEIVTPLCDEVRVDAMGNVIALKKGKESKKVMCAAHMDEISFIVSHIDDEGFIRFQPLGGFDPKTLTAQRVIIHGKKDVMGAMGGKPIHIMTPEEKSKGPKMEDYSIDTGMSKEELEKWVSVGDPITRERELIEMGDCVNAKSIDNRVSVFILLETLRELKDTEIAYDFYAVFTVQEEVGLRGAYPSAHAINPDFGINLDTTIAYDTPGSQAHEAVTRLGNGTAIKVLDGRTICDYRMVKFMKETADKHKIKWQAEILPRGGTDTAAIQRAADGSIAGGISIPTRNLHQVIEMCNKADVKACIDLMKACLIEMGDYDWSFK